MTDRNAIKQCAMGSEQADRNEGRPELTSEQGGRAQWAVWLPRPKRQSPFYETVFLQLKLLSIGCY